MRPCALVLGLLLAGVARAAPEEADIRAIVRDAMDYWKVPGCAVVIVHEDKVVYLRGHGVRELGSDEAVTPDTLFPMGSCSKAFTTAGLAVLVGEGKLGWDDRVRKHLPWFRLSDPLVEAEVTIRDLLCHRTGLAGHDLLWFHAAWSPEEGVRRAAHLPLDRPFRSAFQYQTTMYTAAGLALASAAGSPWDEFVRGRLLDPLGMRNTCLTTTEAAKKRDRALGHRHNERGEIVPSAEWYPMPRPDPAGSVSSTARDLASWLRLHLNDGEIGGKRIVAASALAQTHQPQMPLRREGEAETMNPDTEQMSYAMAWLVRDHRGAHVVEHAGAIDGFRAHVTLVPRQKLGIALLNNLHQTRLNLAVSNRLVDLYLGLPRKDWNKLLGDQFKKELTAAAGRERQRLARRHLDTQPSLPLAGYAGDYSNAAYGPARVSVEEGRLVCRLSSFTMALEHFHFNTFTARHDQLGRVTLTFQLDATGKASSLDFSEPLTATFSRAAR